MVTANPLVAGVSEAPQGRNGIAQGNALGRRRPQTHEAL